MKLLKYLLALAGRNGEALPLKRIKGGAFYYGLHNKNLKITDESDLNWLIL